MSSPSEPVSAILRTILYADIFDFAITSNEIYQRLLINSSKLSDQLDISTISQILTRQMASHCTKTGDYWTLKHRTQLATLRHTRQQAAQEKLQQIKPILNHLQKIPTIECIALTGSLAAHNALPDDDVDLLIICTPGTLWTTRLQITALLELLQLRRRPNTTHNSGKICLNLFLDKTSMSVPEHKQNIYTAHEVVLAQPLWSNNGTYKSFLKSNNWVQKYLPNALQQRQQLADTFTPKPTSHIIPKVTQVIEPITRQLQYLYMKPKKTIEQVTTSSAYFHPQDHTAHVLQEYQHRLIRYNLH